MQKNINPVSSDDASSFAASLSTVFRSKKFCTDGRDNELLNVAMLLDPRFAWKQKISSFIGGNLDPYQSQKNFFQNQKIFMQKMFFGPRNRLGEKLEQKITLKISVKFVKIVFIRMN
jgi:hypothetical protein